MTRTSILTALLLATCTLTQAAEGGATAEQATAMVKKGVVFIKAQGAEKGYAEITSKTGQFRLDDLYLVVYGLDGAVHAHGANEKMVGRNLIELKDIDGKAFVKERVEMGKAILDGRAIPVDADGQVVRRFVPEGLVYDASTYEVVDSLPAILATRRGNRGFEGVALSPDETTLFAAVQSPLNNPDGDTGAASRNARIIAFDLATETVVGEYVYQFEESTVFGADVVPGDMKISGLIALDSDTLLVLERTDFVAHIYRVELAGAENILGSAWDDAATAPSLEASDMSGMTDGMMSKTMVIDLSTLAETPNKIEGMALVDDDTIAIANDNDFDIGDFGADDFGAGRDATHGDDNAQDCGNDPDRRAGRGEGQRPAARLRGIRAPGARRDECRGRGAGSDLLLRGEGAARPRPAGQ